MSGKAIHSIWSAFFRMGPNDDGSCATPVAWESISSNARFAWDKLAELSDDDRKNRYETTYHILTLVLAERKRQDLLKSQGRFPATCADEYLADSQKLAVLMEEVGEATRAVIELENLCNDKRRNTNDAAREALKTELIQVAAVAVAWAESL